MNDNDSFSLLNVLLSMSSAASKDTSTMAIDFLQLSVLLMLKSFTQWFKVWIHNFKHVFIILVDMVVLLANAEKCNPFTLVFHWLLQTCYP